MSNTPLDYMPPPPPPRPVLLHYLLLSTFLGASLSALAHGVAAWDFGGYWDRTLNDLRNDNFGVQFFDDSQVVESIQAYSRVAQIETATSLLRLVAAFLMWRKKGIGLLVYTLATLVSFFSSFYIASLPRILDTSYTSWFPYINSHHLSLFFLVCYLSQWKGIMGKN